MEQNFWNRQVKEGAVLNRVDRTAEVLFGLITVLTFTGAISAATDGQQEVSELLWGALGCNLAWGIVDAIMYLMNVSIERGHGISVIKRIKKSVSQEESLEIIKDEISPTLSAIMKNDELNLLSQRLQQLPDPEEKLILTWKDIFTAFKIFLLVFICIFPVALPFAIFSEVEFAKRASNGVALVLLFIAGYKLAGFAGFKPIITALIYTALGVLLVGLTMALGG